MSKKYKRKTIDSVSIPIELYHDAFEELDEHQFNQIIRAGILYTEAEANGKEFEQPDFDQQAKVAFNLFKRHLGYSNEAKRQYNFNAKFNKDFNKGDKVPPELIACQYNPDELAEMGYTAEEVGWIEDKIKAFQKKMQAAVGTPSAGNTPSAGKIVTEQRYDQRPNDEPDGYGFDHLKELHDRYTKMMAEKGKQ